MTKNFNLVGNAADESPLTKALNACAHEITAAYAEEEGKESWKAPFVRIYTITIKIKDFHYEEGNQCKVKGSVEVLSEPMNVKEGGKP